MEGRLISETLIASLKRLGVKSSSLDLVRAAIIACENGSDGLGFCLSQTPDLLSQWRGYAVDGHGFSLGFSKRYLDLLQSNQSKNNWSIKLHQVKYDPKEHQEELIKATNIVYDFIKSTGTINNYELAGDNLKCSSETELEEDAFYLSSLRTLVLVTTLEKMFVLKNHAFHEEKEWRLISILGINASHRDCSIDVRVDTTRLIPYRTVDLADYGTAPITEVYIGPKNKTPAHVVQLLLRKNGFENVKIIPSSATYR